MKIQHFMALVVLSLATFPGARAATVWNGPTISFTKSNYANPLLAQNQDRLTANVWITRGSSQGLFNAKTESSFTHYLSPAGTEWANGSLENYATLSYTNWNRWAAGVNPNPRATVGVQAVVHLIPDDIYLSVQFTSWSGGAPGGGPSYGGGFSYLRSTPVPEPQVNYAISGSTAYVTNSPNASGAIVIASSYNGYPVTSVASGAFSRCTNLTSVTIPASVTSIYAQAFYGCSRMTNFTFPGNAPALVFDIEAGGAHFLGVGAGARAYYYCGTTGWGATYGGLPTMMLLAPRVAPGSAGMKPGGFGFALTCLTNQSIVVEASANLVNWQPIWTNNLPGASANFTDAQWTNYPSRFYRARSD